jgi:ribose 5-phosphate isomerase B
MGMAIVANKYPGIYTAVCEPTFAKQKARSIHNSNVLILGGFVATPHIACEIVNVWMRTEFAWEWPDDVQAWLHQPMLDIAHPED